VNLDPQSADSDRWGEPSLRLPWLVAPAVSAAVVLIMVGVASVLWPHQSLGVPASKLTSGPVSPGTPAAGSAAPVSEVSALPTPSTLPTSKPSEQTRVKPQTKAYQKPTARPPGKGPAKPKVTWKPGRAPAGKCGKSNRPPSDPAMIAI
jgi:hypothetical protein